MDDVDFIVVPYNAVGSIPVIEAYKRNIKIYAVIENKTVLDVTFDKLNLNCEIFDSYEDLLKIL